MIQHLDLQALRRSTPPSVPWQVPSFLAQGALTLFVGEPGTGKSLVALALGKAISEGAETMGWPCLKNKVILFDAENGESEIHRRVHALEIQENLEPCVVQNFSLGVNLSEVEDFLFHNPEIGTVIFDSLRTLWPDGDENDSGSVTNMLVPIQEMARTHSVGVILIHHMNKSGSYRGSGALTAVPEVVIELGRNRKDKDPSRRYMEWLKCRPAPAPSRKWLRIMTDEFDSVCVVPAHKPEPLELWPE